GAVRSSYSRYEKAETAPQITTLYKLGKNYNVSLDWLILNKGPMYYKEKEIEIEKKNQKPKPKPDAETLQTITEEYDELKTLMERIPLLRYEIMSLLYKFKEDRQELVEAARLD
ncbi:MAG: helix-turn-helix transcriptional regulator, partial [bacterium]|nr:helix-turn-helix transcriptional regulator [bacterium]